MRKKEAPYKPSTEIHECFEALRNASLSLSLKELETLVADGEKHLQELEGTEACNLQYIQGFASRLDKVRSLLSQREALEATTFKKNPLELV